MSSSHSSALCRQGAPLYRWPHVRKRKTRLGGAGRATRDHSLATRRPKLELQEGKTAAKGGNTYTRNVPFIVKEEDLVEEQTHHKNHSAATGARTNRREGQPTRARPREEHHPPM